ncbi:hypothetical protein [Thalassovita sp.]|uniref:hypothetical protein n=1 Tax=Thalassovita sp. TaxID=1979401 RepID=UPI0029DE8C51|nr:hypothetical protein [Thalassovita sp.]
MKKLLATTALATLAMSGHASAQSLLESLLTNADELSASITNLAQNSGTLNASINVDTSRNIAGIDAIVDTLMDSTDQAAGFGSVSTVGTNVARDFAMPDLSFLAPLEMTMGDLATTGIGAMQSGSMDVSFDASGLESRLADRTEASTTMAESIDETYGSIDAGLSFQNLAYNTADIEADINLALDDVNATLGNLATTAIGAMGSGDLAASITGQILDGENDTINGDDIDVAGAASDNLIEALLASVGDVSASISNIAENSGYLDASIDIDTSRNLGAIEDVIATLMDSDGDNTIESGEGFGSLAQVGDNIARDFAMPDMSFLDPLQLTLGDLATTGIGAMQSGSMDVSFDASGLATLASDVSSGSTTMAESITETYGAIDAGLSFQNVAFNTADIDATINLLLNDVNTTAGNLATTAIGAMGSGDLTASITGRLADTSESLNVGGDQGSQLNALLGDAEDLSAAITNLAENQGQLDADVDITTTQSLADILLVLETLGQPDGFGSYSEVAADVFARDNEFPNMAFLAPLEATIGDIATTGIGAMQSGNLTVSFDASGLMQMTSDISSGESTSASTIAQNYGGIESGLAIQNVAFNDLTTGNPWGDIDASINLALNDVNATVGNLATTAIGAMGSGDLTANLVGRLVGDTSIAN